MMKKIKQINNWTIKEKALKEVPKHIADNRKYVVFSPTDICQEDNLTYDEAVEFCQNNLDHVQKSK
jgi:aromatic ring-opening dioxygenase LigB subunit